MGAPMTTEQLVELLGKVTQGEWKAYPVAERCNETFMEVPSIGYDGELCEHDATLIALAPSLARRVIAAERMATAFEHRIRGADNATECLMSIHTYREASK